MINGLIKSLPLNERPRERLMQCGSGNLSDSQLLSIIISSGNFSNGSDAIKISIDLLNKFSDIKGIDLASINELCSVNGIGFAKATRIKAAIELGKRFIANSNGNIKKFRSCEEVAGYYIPIMENLKKEQFRTVLLDSKNKFLKEEIISEGSLNMSVVHPREVFVGAIRESAMSIIFIHNHPSGDPTPSEDDIRITERLVKAGNIIGIKALDHLIIGGGGFFSFSDRGLI